ncbi:MAG: cyclophilin-like fold protein [Neisseria sp.]|nr:cyclophilin-like fold protein [Neisseria sp.]
MRKTFIKATALFATAAAISTAAAADVRALSQERIKVKYGNEHFTVQMFDNPTANDFLAKLPLTIKLSDYGGVEKYHALRQPLSMQNAPKGDDPELMELGYYHPSQWLAFYYGPMDYWAGKVPLGKIHATAAQVKNIPANVNVVIERVK